MADVSAELVVCSPGAGCHRRHPDHASAQGNSRDEASWKGVDARTAQELEFLQSLAGLNNSVGGTSALGACPSQQPQRQESSSPRLRSALSSSLQIWTRNEADDPNGAQGCDVELSGSPNLSPKGPASSIRSWNDDLAGPGSVFLPDSPTATKSKWGRLSLSNKSSASSHEDISRRPSTSGTSPPRLFSRVSESFKASNREIFGIHLSSPIIRARKFTEMLHGFDIDSQSMSFKRAASRASSHRSVLSGRANMGEVVQGTSDAMDMLLAVETAIFNMMKDSKKESSRPATCMLNDEDYKASQKVLCIRGTLHIHAVEHDHMGKKFLPQKVVKNLCKVV
jgi:hypothetical protein